MGLGLLMSHNLTITKLDRHFHGMFGFLAIKDDINVYADNPDSACRIKQALTWYRSHNHLYSSFYSNYETLPLRQTSVWLYQS